MKLYYGADKDLKNPEYGVGSTNNDYGLGFYMTNEYDKAVLWASKFENGYVMTYEFDDDNLKILNLEGTEEIDVLRWIAVLVNHRFDKKARSNFEDTINWLSETFPINLDAYDVIVGYRADDSYFKYSKEFVEDRLSFEILKKAMMLGKLGLQYVAISKKAFSKIKWLKSEKIKHTTDYEKFQITTLNEFQKLKNEDNVNNTFIRDIRRKYAKKL